jgi:hypothetical protein
LRAKALLALNRLDEAMQLLDGSPHGAAPERVLTRVELLLRRGDEPGARREWKQQETAVGSLLSAGGESAIDALRVKALLAMSAGDPAGAEDALKIATRSAADVDGNPVPGLRKIAMLRAESALRSGATARACDSAKVVTERAEAEAVDASSSAWIGEGLLLRARCEQARGLLDAMHASARAALPHLEQNLGEQHPLSVQARALMSDTAAPSSASR